MPRLLARLRAALSPGRRSERRQAEALAAKLGVPRDEATRILRRSREVGYGAAMLERAPAAEDATEGDPG